MLLVLAIHKSKKKRRCDSLVPKTKGVSLYGYAPAISSDGFLLMILILHWLYSV